jgi:acetyl-CoA C-acetyltransferase
MNKWGELWNSSLRDVFVEAALKAIDDAGVDHIDSMYVGCMSSGLFVAQEHIGSLMSDYLGMNPIPCTRVESACASGGLAFRQAYMEVASGMSDIVLAGGVEKMNDVDGGGATYALATAADQEYEAYNGVTFPGLYALIAMAHMNRYGTTREQLAQVAVKNHANGALNPEAQFPMKITVDQVLSSPGVADPLRLLDCSPITDGAAAAILCPLDMVKKLGKNGGAKVTATAHATNTIALHSRDDLTEIASTAVAAEKAYEMAGVGPRDIDFAEVHDCFTIAEICVIEALGLVEKGQGGPATAAGDTAREGKMPINTSGGLKSKGHPVGASGTGQVVEAWKQLRGEAGHRQVPGVDLALTHNVGGTGQTCVVHIFERR